MPVQSSVRPRSALSSCSATKRAAPANRRPRCISRSRCSRPASASPPSISTSRQKSFTHYIENRRAWAERARLKLELPTHFCVARRRRFGRRQRGAASSTNFAAAINAIEHTHDFVVIDTPGHDTYLMRLAHSMADTLVTPLNDSFVDFDVLGTRRSGDLRRHRRQAITPTWCAKRAASAASSITPPTTGSWCAIVSRCSARATSAWSARGCRSFRCGWLPRGRRFCRARGLSRILPARPHRARRSRREHARHPARACRTSPRARKSRRCSTRCNCR